MPLEYAAVDLMTPADLRRAIDGTYSEDMSTTYEDAVLDPAIAEISSQFAGYMQQHTLRAERTEMYWIRGCDRMVTLKGCEVDEDSIEILIDDSVLDEDDYMLHADRGWFELFRSLSNKRTNRHKVEVTYTGGLAADAATLATGFPDLHEAALMQAKYRIERKNNIGGPLTIPQGMVASSSGQYRFLRHVEEVLDRYRRWVI